MIFLWKRTFEMFDSRSLGSIKSLEHRRNANTYVLCKKDNNDKLVIIYSAAISFIFNALIASFTARFALKSLLAGSITYIV